MYARLATTRQFPPPEALDPMRDAFVAGVSGFPGFAGLWLLEQIGGPRGAMLSLWHTEDDAASLDLRLEQAFGPQPFPLDSDLVYTVEGAWTGPASDAEPKAATLLFLDGPLGPARVDAALRAGRERIRPIMERAPGLTYGYALWQEQTRALVVVNLAESTEALEALSRAINGSELLPGEDPALLSGPDRVEIHRVGAAVKS